MRKECVQCGASVESALMLTRCPYCDNTLPVEQKNNEVADYDPSSWIIPFELSQKEFSRRIQRYLKPEYASPHDFATNSRITVNLIYVDLELVTIAYNADYSVEARNNDERGKPAWQKISGTHSGIGYVIAFEDENDEDPDFPGRDLLTDILNPENKMPLKKFDPKYLEGYDVLPWSEYKVHQSVEITEDDIDDVISEDIDRFMEGQQETHNWNWELTHINKPEVNTVLIPVCHAEIYHEGERYDVWMDGCSGVFWHVDHLPYDHDFYNLIRGPLYLAYVMGSLSILMSIMTLTEHKSTWEAFLLQVLTAIFSMYLVKKYVNWIWCKVENYATRLLNAKMQQEDPPSWIGMKVTFGKGIFRVVHILVSVMVFILPGLIFTI